VVEREPHGGGRRGRSILSATEAHEHRGRQTPRRDVYVITASLVFLAAIAWLYIVRTPDQGMAVGVLTRPPSDDAMSAMESGSGMSFTLFISTWIVMMIAMMFPAVVPVVLVFDRWRRTRHRSVASTVSFIAGYLAVWGSAGLLVYAALVGIETQVENSTTAVTIGGISLIAAGLYQLSPLKTACLNHCRSPLGLVMQHSRHLGRGLRGPFRVGIVHGAYCLGCCWALMVVLIVLGLMNLGWMAAVAALILVEKTLPAGQAFGRVSGVGIALTGAVVLATASGII